MVAKVDPRWGVICYWYVREYSARAYSIDTSLGIYNLPSFTIARAIGGIFYWLYCRHKKGQEGNIIVLASGLVLGESVASLVNLALKAMHSPQLGE